MSGKTPVSHQIWLSRQIIAPICRISVSSPDIKVEFGKNPCANTLQMSHSSEKAMENVERSQPASGPKWTLAD